MQVVDLLSPITAGVRMLPQLLLIGVLSPLAGAIVVLSKSYRPLMWFSSSLGAIGAGLLSTLAVQTNFPRQYGFEVLAGFSVGVTITVSTIIVQFSTERPDLAAATGFQSFARQFGALVGIAAATAILNGEVASQLNVLAGTNSLLASADLRNAITQNPAGLLRGLDAATKADVQGAYSDGFTKLFVAAAAWFAIGALSTIGLRHQLPIEFVRGKKGNEDVEAETVTDVAESHCNGGLKEKDAQVVERGRTIDSVLEKCDSSTIERDENATTQSNLTQVCDVSRQDIVLTDIEGPRNTGAVIDNIYRA